MKKKLILLFLIPIYSFAQKININDDIKLRVGVMEMIVERKKTNENVFRDANYKMLNFLTFSDQQKKILDTLFSNSWKKRIELYNKIKDTEDQTSINGFVKYLIKHEGDLRNQLTKEQLEKYNAELKNIEGESSDARKVIIRATYFTNDQFAEYLTKFK